MRTTLDLDADVLASAKEIARREKKTAGQVLSELARRALTQGPADSRHGKPEREGEVNRTGFAPFPTRGSVITNELVDALRDEGE